MGRQEVSLRPKRVVIGGLRAANHCLISQPWLSARSARVSSTLRVDTGSLHGKVAANASSNIASSCLRKRSDSSTVFCDRIGAGDSCLCVSIGCLTDTDKRRVIALVTPGFGPGDDLPAANASAGTSRVERYR